MKRMIVGRGVDCDIVIPDEKDNVSRHHMVITFNLLGKMKVSDTSTNGTFINGNRMLKGASIPVTQADNIRLGDNWIFDWNLVKDPYKKTRIGILIGIILLILAGVGVGVWCWHLEQVKKAEREQMTLIKPADQTDDKTWNSDSTSNVAPTETSINVGNAKSADSKATKSSKKKKTTKKAPKQNNKESEPMKRNNSKDSGNDLPLVN